MTDLHIPFLVYSSSYRDMQMMDMNLFYRCVKVIDLPSRGLADHAPMKPGPNDLGYIVISICVLMAPCPNPNVPCKLRFHGLVYDLAVEPDIIPIAAIEVRYVKSASVVVWRIRPIRSIE
jgi:hypothetical protein